jgi:hypothetical protein
MKTPEVWKQFRSKLHQRCLNVIVAAKQVRNRSKQFHRIHTAHRLIEIKGNQRQPEA